MDDVAEERMYFLEVALYSFYNVCAKGKDNYDHGCVPKMHTAYLITFMGCLYVLHKNCHVVLHTEKGLLKFTSCNIFPPNISEKRQIFS